jgi:hypothetical protein
VRHGFKAVVGELVRERPGLSSDDYAKIALERGLVHSDSRDPIFSLQSTLRKEVREGRMPEIVARKVGGKLHFFPANQDGATPAKSASPALNLKQDFAASFTVLVPQEIAFELDLLVELGKAKSRSEALIRLARIGIDTKRSVLNRAREVHEQTKRMRDSLPL